MDGGVEGVDAGREVERRDLEHDGRARPRAPPDGSPSSAVLVPKTTAPATVEIAKPKTKSASGERRRGRPSRDAPARPDRSRPAGRPSRVEQPHAPRSIAAPEPTAARDARRLGGAPLRPALPSAPRRARGSARRSPPPGRRPRARPRSSQSARRQRSATSARSCETKTSVLPARSNSENFSSARCAKASSPTASTSSTRRTSGSLCAAIANPSRTAMPGGVRLDRARRGTPRLREAHDLVEPRGDLPLRQPEQQPVDLDVLAARDLGMEAGAELEQRREPARAPRPCRAVGRTIPASSFSSVDLPEPLAPTTPRVSPGGDLERDVRRAPCTAVRRQRAPGRRESSADLSVPIGRFRPYRR